MTNTAYPLVTIGIPTYNRADNYLKHVLKSAINQTYPNIEIIVSDNCSTDDTETVVKKFSNPRIKYFKQANNIGPLNNFDFALEQAKGNYFLLLPDDDLIDEDFVEICMKQANYATDFGLLRTGTRGIDAQGKVLGETPNMVSGFSVGDFYRGWFKNKTAWYLCSTLFNTKELRKVGGFQSEYQRLPDAIVIAKIAAKFDRIDIPDIKASYRYHPLELTYAAKVSDWCDDFLFLLDLMCELAPENKAEIRAEGMRFFAISGYKRARAVKSLSRRFMAYLTVFKKFNYRYLPPSVNRNPLLMGIRAVRRKFKQSVVSDIL